jgi:hypothetical protein
MEHILDNAAEATIVARNGTSKVFGSAYYFLEIMRLVVSGVLKRLDFDLLRLRLPLFCMPQRSPALFRRA